MGSTLTTTKPEYNSLLDANEIQLVIASSGTRHVRGWYGMTVCGKYCEDNYKWSYGGLTNLRWIARVSQRPQINRFCKSCASQYKDVKYED